MHQVCVQQLQHQSIGVHANQRRDRLAVLQKPQHRRGRAVGLVGIRGENRGQGAHGVEHAAVVVVGAVPQMGTAGLGHHDQFELVDVYQELLHETAHQAALLDQTASFAVVLQGKCGGVQGLVQIAD